MKKRILLIEDYINERENISEVLELAGYEVKTAANGKEGVLLAEQFNPNLIISNVIMPLLDGFGVLQILSKKEHLSKIPFIFLTSKVNYKDMRRGMDLGADDYISKPYKESELLTAIESRLKRIETFTEGIDSNRILSKLNDKDPKSITSLNLFLQNRELQKYRKNETIYCEGNHSNHFFILNKGLVKTFKISSEGKEFITKIHKTDDYIGLASFIINTAHFETATTLTNCELYKITRDELCVLMQNDFMVSRNIMNFLSNDLKTSHDQLIDMAYGSVRKKTAITIIKLAVKLSTNNKLTISRSNLAQSIGIAKETLTRTLHDFKEEGLIKVTKVNIEILRLEKLKMIS